MKNEIILWLCSFILVFSIGYIKNVTDKEYPITGTFGIEGKKVSYKLDKVSYDKTSYKNIIISDIKGIEAKLLLINDGQKNEIPYSVIERGLECKIPKLNPGQKIKYKVLIIYNDKVSEIPLKEFVTLTFWGHIPPFINILNFMLMYGGLLISVRSLLEVFTKNINLKKYAFITCILFITQVIIIYPLYSSYKIGAINHFIPPITALIDPLLTIILVVWIVGSILIFNKKYIRIVTSIIVIVTMIIFFLI